MISQGYQADLSALLALGTADEGPTQPFAITGAPGDPLALLMSLLNAVPVLGWLATGLLATAVLGVGMRTSRARM